MKHQMPAAMILVALTEVSPGAVASPQSDPFDLVQTCRLGVKRVVGRRHSIGIILFEKDIGWDKHRAH